jgi:hypothetical protein
MHLAESEEADARQEDKREKHIKVHDFHMLGMHAALVIVCIRRRVLHLLLLVFPCKHNLLRFAADQGKQPTPDLGASTSGTASRATVVCLGGGQGASCRRIQV